MNFGTDVVLAGQTGRMTRVFLSVRGNQKSNKRQKQQPCIGHCFLPSVSEDEGEVEGEEGLGPRGKAGEREERRCFGILSCQNVQCRWEDTDGAFLLLIREIKGAQSCSDFLVSLYCNVL